MALKRWKLEHQNGQTGDTLARSCGIAPFLAEILANRGIDTPAAATAFLSRTGSWEDPFHMADMDRAVSRIRHGIDAGEAITVYGDYDCDGVTATALLFSYLRDNGARVDYYIPNREGEGYGMNESAVRQLAGRGTNLIITVDNGISAHSEIALANALGMDVVVTDHHQPGDKLPPAAAVVNPHRKDDGSGFRLLAGVGVAFRLLVALELETYGGEEALEEVVEAILANYGELIAIGTVGDVVPLLSENRMLVQRGIENIRQGSGQVGLLALMEAAAVKPETITARQIAFSIVPRINAAGRMDSAELALELLLCEEYEQEKAEALAQELDEKNKLRQELEREILADIDILLERKPELLQGRLLILSGKGWHMGVLGIVASRLLERYGKPTLLMTNDGTLLKGSARSLGEFHLYDALAANGEHLTQFGGHKLAAGFSLEEDRLSAFREGMERYAAAQYARMPEPCLVIDKILQPRELTVEQVRALALLAPFGAENEEPLFLLPGVTLESVTPLSEGRHQRLQCRYGDKSVTALLFGVSAKELLYPVGSKLDLVVNAQLSTFRGETSLSLRVKDLRPTGFKQDRFFAAKNCVEGFLRGEPQEKKLLSLIRPDRTELITLYRWLQTHGGFFGDLEAIATVFDQTKLSYAKLRIMLTAFEEMGLIEISPAWDQVTLCQVTEKVQLENAPVLCRLTRELQ